MPGDYNYALGLGWDVVLLGVDEEPLPETCEEHLEIRLKDKKLLIVVYHDATLFVMNDQGKTIDVVRTI